jgi:hypothetical protein
MTTPLYGRGSVAPIPSRDRQKLLKNWKTAKNSKFGPLGTSPDAVGRVLNACPMIPYPPRGRLGGFEY